MAGVLASSNRQLGVPIRAHYSKQIAQRHDEGGRFCNLGRRCGGHEEGATDHESSATKLRIRNRRYVHTEVRKGNRVDDGSWIAWCHWRKKSIQETDNFLERCQPGRVCSRPRSRAL